MEKDKVIEFDKLVEKINKNRKAPKALSIFLGVIGLFFCFVPFQELMGMAPQDAILLMSYGTLFIAGGVICELNRMIVIGSENFAQGVYSVLKYTPCTKEAIINSRIKKMLNYILIFLAFALVAKVALDIGLHSPYIVMDVMVIFLSYGFLPAVFGLGYIYTTINYVKKR